MSKRKKAKRRYQNNRVGLTVPRRLRRSFSHMNSTPLERVCMEHLRNQREITKMACETAERIAVQLASMSSDINSLLDDDDDDE